MTARQFNPVPSASRRETVAQTLRAAIVAGRLRPGDRLREVDLADQLGTSRAPVREALRQLEQEGLVITQPYKATEVLGVTQEEIEQVLVPLRVTLERFAFRKALSRLTADDLVKLDRLVEQMRFAGDAGDADALASADVCFHELIMKRADQPHTLQLWWSIEPRVRAHFRRDARAHVDPQEVAGQHRELLEVIRTGDESAAMDAVEHHIRDFLSAPDVACS